ncbi:uncharacterized protein LOC130980294 [Arachis stenosperma]|uniref:uncharacterized protein LOC130980294 n=1 Tax=Arachis stenosperma TaxID=217475 RepID=UPI0025ACCC60|nr:uncharacterized protein LOC130980294 [Arachis stenosperma]
MASDESFVVLVHHRGSIKRKTRSGVKFTNKDPFSIFMRPTTSYDDLVNSVLQKLGLEGVKRVKKFFYRISISVRQEIVKYDCFTIRSDEDLHVMLHCRRQFPEVRTPELLAKLVDVVSSSGGSNWNTHTVGTVAGSSSRPVGVCSSDPVYEPPVEPVASPHDDDVEPNIIADDSSDDIGASEPAGAGAALDLDAMRQEGVPGEPDGFGARDAEGSSGLTEFQVGQQFQDKDEYKVVESDYRRYVGKCSEFGNACTWLIRLSLRQRKGIWEVKRADASVSIKVLLNATVAHFGFKPTYRRVLLAKQKAVAHIYGDWDESYNELPRWVLGVQLTMPGTVVVLKTSPVRVGGQVDDSQAYFHRLFWTFPPCIEAFRHCKPLVSIDDTHLYGKYGGTLLVAIAQDGNSNILLVAFALVKGENAESWSFFLSHLRQHVTPQSDLLVISDRHNGIKAVLEAPDGDGYLQLPTVHSVFDMWQQILP